MQPARPASLCRRSVGRRVAFRAGAACGGLAGAVGTCGPGRSSRGRGPAASPGIMTSALPSSTAGRPGAGAPAVTLPEPLRGVSLLGDPCPGVELRTNSTCSSVARLAPEHTCTCRELVTGFENSCQRPNAHPSLSPPGGDRQQVGARPGHAETGVPGTAVTPCHCGQLSAPAASCHHARHETHPLSDAAGKGCVIN